MSDNQSVVYDAAKSQNWEKVMELCASCPSRVKYAGPSDGMTALHLACQNQCQNPEVFEVLVEASPEVLLVQDNSGMVPLHYACRFQAPPEVVGLLVHLRPEQGHAAASKRDQQGKIPLYHAERNNAHPDVVEMLRELSPASSSSGRIEQEDRFDATTSSTPSLPKPDLNIGRQTSFARAFFNSAGSSMDGSDVVDREMAAALAASASVNETVSGPEPWMADAWGHQKPTPRQEEQPGHEWSGHGWTEDSQPGGGGGLNEFGNREILEQYRIMAEHEAHGRLKKMTGFDREEFDKSDPVVGRIDDEYRKTLLTPRLPQPRRVTVNNSMPELQEPVLPSIPLKQVSRESRSQIAPKVVPGVIVNHSDEVPPDEQALQCLGCLKKLRVKRKALFASCPNCSAKSPAISIRDRGVAV